MSSHPFRFIVLIPLLFFFASCGEIRKPVQPVYRFELNKPLLYKLKVQFNVSLDMGLAKYSGLVDFTADVELKAIETNTNGWKIAVDIRNPDVRGADSRINTAIYMGLNMIRNWFPSFQIDRYGKVDVWMNGVPQMALSEFMSAVFPDFSDMDALIRGASHKTNFAATMQSSELTMVFLRTETLKNSDSRTVALSQTIEVNTFDKDEYEKSVDPVPMGSFTLDMDEAFDSMKGELQNKAGKMELAMKVPIKQGIFSYNILVQGNGTLELLLAEPAM
jgi:hypothetical protein